MDALNQITEGMTGQEVAQIIYQNDSNSLTDYIVSYLHPTEGVNGTNVYTLTTAIAKIPQDIRKQGITCTFLSINGWLSYKYIGNTIINDNWNTTSNWILIATEKELSNLATQNSMMHLIGSNKTVNVSFDEANTSVTISLPSGLFLSYGNTRIADSATINGQIIIDPMTSGKLKYLVYNLSENQYKLVDYADQMNNSVLVGWVNQYLKEAILRCNKYVVNGIPQSFNDYIPKTDISHNLETTDANKVLGADQAIRLATQNGMMEILGADRTVSIDFSDSDFSVTISLPDKLLLSYGNTRIIDSATSNGQVITDSMTNYRYKYLIYNLTTSKYELVLQTAQMNNSVLVGWINQYTKTAVLLCDNYTVNGLPGTASEIAKLTYDSIPTTVIQLKKYADDGYALLQLISSIDTEVKITGGYVSYNTENFTETSIGIKKETLTNLYFKCVESYAMIEAKGVYSITVASNLTYNYVVQNIKDFGNLLTQVATSYNNGISGEIKDFNQGMTYIRIGGGSISKPNISGEFKDLPRLLTYLQLSFANGISVGGNVADLPRKLTYLYLNTSLRPIGNPADLPKGLTYLNIYNLNNEFNGDIADFPRGLTSLTMSGTDYNISGNITDLPPNVQALQISGSSTIQGDISDLPKGLKYIMLWGNCNLKGSLADLPTGTIEISVQSMDAANPIIGDISDIPYKNVTLFRLRQNFNITFNGEFPLSDKLYSFELRPSETFPIDSVTVDNILIKLAAIVGERTVTRTISLLGACAAPTEASQAAITSLQQKGFTVQTN